MPNRESSRIAKNTFLLYLRMIIVMAVNLWTVRLVLKALGVVDYGIYDVVAGIVAMIHSVSTVLSSSAQRYYSFYLGKKSVDDIQKVFTACINIFVVFSLLTLVIGESIGMWLVNSHLVIPFERLAAANWVFHFSILSLIFLMLQTPFAAVVIAEEDMGIFSIVSLVECFAKFLLALWLSYATYDRLFLYGGGLMVIALISFIFYLWIVYRKYSVFKYIKVSISKSLYKEIVSFSGWILVASVAGISMNQLSTIFVNIFFGPTVNAARAISFQVNNLLNSFCGSFTTAIRPPMIKSYAQGNYNKLNLIFSISNKILYYGMLMISLPLFLEMETLFQLWLNTKDEQTILFSRLILIYVVILSLNTPITFIIYATGRVKEYHLLVEIPIILSAPITYVLFKMSAPAYAAYIVLIIAVIVSHVFRLYSIRKWYADFDLIAYIRGFLLPALYITIFVVLFVSLVNSSIGNGLCRIILTLSLSVISFSILSILFGISKTEKVFLLSMVKEVWCKFTRNGIK